MHETSDTRPPCPPAGVQHHRRKPTPAATGLLPCAVGTTTPAGTWA